ncbi:MAG: multicomponent Na+:H+ antiporter subunit D [Paracoccaceae bacterium]|jgi:multicomponent Na+:H+ antiporter subunit D
MMEHLPILVVVVPMLAAPACLLFERGKSAWLFSILACLISLLLSALLLQQVVTGGPISYELGGWSAPWGIEFRADPLSAFVLLLVSAIASTVIIAAHRSLQAELAEPQQPFFYVLFLICVCGLLGIVASGDVFNVFVFLEISSLASYALVALGRERQALRAAFQYLVVGTIGATFFLVGIGFLYSLSGTLNMAELAVLLPDIEERRLLTVAFAFILVGIGLKLAIFPLHGWLPNAYTYAPSIATALLAATATKVSLYLLIRFYFDVFGGVATLLPVDAVLLVVGITAALVASLVAIQQSNVKRLFAFSSIAQIGYMAVGIGLGSAAGLQASLLHLFNHALMKAALFIALAAVVYRQGGCQLEHFRGLGRSMPWTMAGLLIAALSLVGVPLTAGFISKWYLVLASLESGYWPIAVLVLVASFLALFYVWKIVEVAYFEPTSDNPHAELREAPGTLLVPLWILVVANLYFGIDTRLPVGGSASAAAFMFGGAP